MRCVLILLVLPACGPDVFAYDTFNFDRAHWTLEGQTVEGAIPTLDKTHGNPSGDLCASDDAPMEDRPWRFIAPVNYSGDASAYFGRSITWDAITSTTLQPLERYDAIFIETSGETIAAPPDNNAVAGETWTKLSVSLDMRTPWHFYGLDAGVSDGGSNVAGATEADVRRVLSNVTSFKIRGEWSGSSESSCIDNIYFGIP